MNSRRKFHVDHDVRPAHVTAVLRQLSPFVGDVRPRILAELRASGHRINPHYLFWNLKVMRALGLTEMDEKTEGWQLTRRGAYVRAMAEWNPRAFSDIMHYLYYASWDFTDQENTGFSWTYQTACNLLWERRPTVIDAKALAAEVRDLAERQFNLDTVSITDYAIDGVYNWVRELDPVFAWTDRRRRRRETNGGRVGCTPELFLMAIDYLYRRQNLAYNRPVVMDDERIALVCRLCLLDLMKWKSVLNRTVEQFDILTRSATASGPQVKLERSPRLIVWPGDTDTTPVDVDSLEEPVEPTPTEEAEDEEDLEEEDEA